LKQLENNHGLESTPSTSATPMMMGEMQERIIPNRFTSNPFLASRWLVQTLFEGLGGCRVGEATSGGDFHGVLANNTSVILDGLAQEEWARETVELRLEHSKTGHPRYIDIAGVTVNTRLQLAKALREYWARAGIETSHAKEGHLRVERPDFWVVKVTMLGMEDGDVKKFLEWLGGAQRSEGVLKHAKHSIKYAKDRYGASTGSQAKKHVHIAGGRGGSRSVQEALLEARRFVRSVMSDRLSEKEADMMVAVVYQGLCWCPLSTC
jgi:hypothetical protein